jgi:hypothetical protein
MVDEEAGRAGGIKRRFVTLQTEDYGILMDDRGFTIEEIRRLWDLIEDGLFADIFSEMASGYQRYPAQLAITDDYIICTQPLMPRPAIFIGRYTDEMLRRHLELGLPFSNESQSRLLLKDATQKRDFNQAIAHRLSMACTEFSDGMMWKARERCPVVPQLGYISQNLESNLLEPYLIARYTPQAGTIRTPYMVIADGLGSIRVEEIPPEDSWRDDLPEPVRVIDVPSDICTISCLPMLIRSEIYAALRRIYGEQSTPAHYGGQEGAIIH